LAITMARSRHTAIAPVVHVELDFRPALSRVVGTPIDVRRI
jgi:hypothetical protein